MPIILAIEPDRRQRSALGAVVRQRVGAELILADTTERALEAIGNRVPDLVLVPALLSPQDDAALAAALRVIAAAAHVRTLTIPVLATGTESEPRIGGGLLSRWRRGRDESQAPDGCDPAVFADQIKAYLAEAAAERRLRQEDAGGTDVSFSVVPPSAVAAISEFEEEHAVEVPHADPFAAELRYADPGSLHVGAITGQDNQLVDPFASAFEPRPAHDVDDFSLPIVEDTPVAAPEIVAATPQQFAYDASAFHAQATPSYVPA